MLPEKRIPSHPGRILRDEFLVPAAISQVRLAQAIQVAPNVISEIINGRRGISPEMALALGKALGTSPELWLNLQTAHDLGLARESTGKRKIERLAG